LFTIVPGVVGEVVDGDVGSGGEGGVCLGELLCERKSLDKACDERKENKKNQDETDNFYVFHATYSTTPPRLNNVHKTKTYLGFQTEEYWLLFLFTL